MNENTRLMLTALLDSSNYNTSNAAEEILNNADVEGESARLRASNGFYGDFITCVMSGDFLLAYGKADRLNQQALASVLRN